MTKEEILAAYKVEIEANDKAVDEVVAQYENGNIDEINCEYQMAQLLGERTSIKNKYKGMIKNLVDNILK